MSPMYIDRFWGLLAVARGVNWRKNDAYARMIDSFNQLQCGMSIHKCHQRLGMDMFSGKYEHRRNMLDNGIR